MQQIIIRSVKNNWLGMDLEMLSLSPLPLSYIRTFSSAPAPKRAQTIFSPGGRGDAHKVTDKNILLCSLIVRFLDRYRGKNIDTQGYRILKWMVTSTPRICKQKKCVYFAQKVFVFHSFYLRTKTYNNVRVSCTQPISAEYSLDNYRPPHPTNFGSYFSYAMKLMQFLQLKWKLYQCSDMITSPRQCSFSPVLQTASCLSKKKLFELRVSFT
jgi:hypothetical protein